MHALFYSYKPCLDNSEHIKRICQFCVGSRLEVMRVHAMISEIIFISQKWTFILLTVLKQRQLHTDIIVDYLYTVKSLQMLHLFVESPLKKFTEINSPRCFFADLRIYVSDVQRIIYKIRIMRYFYIAQNIIFFRNNIK